MGECVERHICLIGIGSPSPPSSCVDRSTHDQRLVADPVVCCDRGGRRRSMRWWHSAMNDLRYALRTLARSPGFTLAAVVTLALGIGANTAVFSVVEGVLLRSLPFPGADRLRLILSKSGTSPLRVYETWRTATGAFEDMAAARGEQPVMISPEGAERVTTWTVTANFFPMLGGRAVLGRTFLPEEDRPGSAPVAVLSYAFWQSHFGGDRQVLGRTVTLDTVGYTIVGVMSPDFRTPAGFRHPDDTQLWRAMGSFLSGPSGAEWA